MFATTAIVSCFFFFSLLWWQLRSRLLALRAVRVWSTLALRLVFTFRLFLMPFFFLVGRCCSVACRVETLPRKRSLLDGQTPMHDVLPNWFVEWGELIVSFFFFCSHRSLFLFFFYIPFISSLLVLTSFSLLAWWSPLSLRYSPFFPFDLKKKKTHTHLCFSFFFLPFFPCHSLQVFSLLLRLKNGRP